MIYHFNKTLVFHARSNHIGIRFHCLRDFSNEGLIDVKYYRSSDHIECIMTNTFKLEAFEKKTGYTSCKALNQVN